MSLTGRVETLESAVTQLQQDLLTTPSLTTFSQYQSTVNQTLNTVVTNINKLISDLVILRNLYTNLHITNSNQYVELTGSVGNLSGLFITHTGLPASKAHSGLA